MAPYPDDVKMPTQRPYHHGELRRALLDAALGILAAEGASALTLRGIARRAGVSHQAPYHHFADRAALVAAVAQEGFDRLAIELGRARRTAPGPVERLQAGGVAYIAFAVRRPELFRIMFGPELADRSAHPGLDHAARQVFAGLLAPASEILPSPPVGPDPVGATLWSAVHGLAMLIIDGQLLGQPRQGRPRSKRAAVAAARRLTLAVTERLWFGVERLARAADGAGAGRSSAR